MGECTEKDLRSSVYWRMTKLGESLQIMLFEEEKNMMKKGFANQ